MLVGIYNLKDPNGRDLLVNQFYQEILELNEIPSIRLSAEQPDFWNKVKDLSLFILRVKQLDSHLQIARDLLPVVEKEYGVPCYPNQAGVWHYDDKIKQTFLLQAHGYPIVPSRVFYEKGEALAWSETAEYPVVFKLKGGAGSMNVMLVETKQQARRLIRKMFSRGILPEKQLRAGSVRFQHINLYREFHRFCGNVYRRAKGLDVTPYWRVHKNYALFQQFLPGNLWDTRVTVIGRRAFAFRRMTRDDDFRASGSGRINYDMEKIDRRFLEIAFDVSRTMGFQSMAYDFLIDGVGNPAFCEISYTYQSKAVFDCPGYWDQDMEWHPGHFWPEYLHLVDCLGIPDLKSPHDDKGRFAGKIF